MEDKGFTEVSAPRILDDGSIVFRAIADSPDGAGSFLADPDDSGGYTEIKSASVNEKNLPVRGVVARGLDGIFGGGAATDPTNKTVAVYHDLDGDGISHTLEADSDSANCGLDSDRYGSIDFSFDLDLGAAKCQLAIEYPRGVTAPLLRLEFFFPVVAGRVSPIAVETRAPSWVLVLTAAPRPTR